MKTVIDIDTLKEVKVPSDYRECSVCGKFCHPHSFSRYGNHVTTRTNCETCYNMPYDDMVSLSENTKKRLNSMEYKNPLDLLHKKAAYFHNSISVGDMIAELSKWDKDDRVFISQDGYYAQGTLADIFLPEYNNISYDGVTFLCIGSSSQHP